jgi:hypothetical protein
MQPTLALRRFVLPLFAILALAGCASRFHRVQLGDPALPSASLSGSRWTDKGRAYLTCILEIDGTPTQVNRIWKEADSRTEFSMPAGRHVINVEVREHATFNGACVAYGSAQVEIELTSGHRYYLRSTVRDNTATTELIDLATFEAVSTLPEIPLKRGLLGLPVKL